MKVLVVGSGGREHALVWKIAQSPEVKEVFCAPGNGGIAQIATCLPIPAEDIQGLVSWARDNRIDLTVVGPEAPLVAGIADAFMQEGLKIFGPRAQAALIEGSKSFAKEIMAEAGVPTASHRVFCREEEALAYLEDLRPPVVVKADGLAGGKGVTVAFTLEESRRAIQELFRGRFKGAGAKVLIEEFLQGEEVSVLAFCDGERVMPLLASQDHKRLGEGDTGPNTGGMGAYAPVPFFTQEIAHEVEEKILKPVVRALNRRGCPYRGVLYAGLMLTEEGPKVLEFNCRFGDPETQPLMLLLKSDLLEILLAVVEGNLEGKSLEWHGGAAAGVVLASRGYPGEYEKGHPIHGLEEVPEDVVVFHAGTQLQEGRLITAGGRVLCVTSRGKNLREALDKVYGAIEKIRFQGMYYRRDIGYRALRLLPHA